MALVLAGCASRPAVEGVPPDAEPVASVRPPSGPAAFEWIAASALPPDAQRGDRSRALLLEVVQRDGSVQSTEIAPLELANLIVRIGDVDSRRYRVSLESTLDRDLKLDLYVSPDGERFRYASSCPIVAGGSALESFAEPLSWVAVARVRFADAAGRCE